MKPVSETAGRATGEKPSRVNILMVDDEPANLLALEAVLGGLGQRLVKAGSGKEALRHLIQDEFALILLDVSMPDLDGFETARMIRERDKTRWIPIIFLTAVGKTESEIFQGYEAGGVDYLLKPLVPEILRSKVSIFIELYNKTRQISLLNEELKGRARDLEAFNQELKRENAERRRAEEELRVSEEKLKNLNSQLERRVAERSAVAEAQSLELTRSNAELQQFVHVASHDLKEPVRMITSFVQLLDDKLRNSLDAEAREYIHYTVDGAHRIQRLIEDLLSYTRLGAQPFLPGKVRLTDVFEEALLNLRLAMEEAGATVTCDPLPEVEADHTHMLLLFQNLIGNAIKFRDKEPPKVHVSAVRNEGNWLFSVEDNGIGIDPRYFERIFIVFQRLHPRDQYPGTGIGLALCRKIVEQHGGKIWVESKADRGAIFRFTIVDQGGDRGKNNG